MHAWPHHYFQTCFVLPAILLERNPLGSSLNKKNYLTRPLQFQVIDHGPIKGDVDQSVVGLGPKQESVNRGY